ncbi:GNAT family N-acetyltransferase [Streptomyces sp. WY228]|nr:GNAT family N-acetyltransferase [Streptomyces sp. WY228]
MTRTLDDIGRQSSRRVRATRREIRIRPRPSESNGRVVLGLDAEIGGLFVAPEAQGTGMGRRLVEHAAALHGSLTLEVYEKNTRARGFYARMGFVEESRRVDEEYDEVLLKLVRPAPETVRSDEAVGPV